MKKIFVGIFILLFTATAGYCTSPVPTVPATEQNIIGEWTKKYILQDGRDNADPRWVLKVTFQKDGKFIYDSTSTQEEWLVNTETGQQTTKAIEEKIQLKGTYSLKDDKVFIKFIKDLTDKDKEVARVKLGYDDQRKEAVVQVSLEAVEVGLVLHGLNSKSIVYFAKQCSANDDCANISCAKYDRPVKEGFKPYCVDNKCQCKCYGCE